MVRRSIAAGAGLLLLILLVLGFRGCLDARKERAFKDYVRDVGALVGESDAGSDALFDLLQSRGDASEVDIQNQLNTFRNQAGQLADRARETDHPEELDTAHNFLVQTLEFRRDGVGAIADELPKAIAARADRRQGTQRVAASMQNFLTSDVIYQTRVVPALRDPLREEGLLGEAPVPKSEFLPDIDWVQPETVADRVSSLGGTGAAADGDAAPGLHGNGLAGVTLGGQALTPGGSANVKLSEDLKFVVQVANQGENTETDVKVSVTIGRGGDAIKVDDVLDTIAAGETKPVEIPLAEQPPTGQNVPIEIQVAGVPGEKKLDNNKGTFSAIFIR